MPKLKTKANIMANSGAFSNCGKNANRATMLLTQQKESLTSSQFRLDNLCFHISRSPEILEVIFKHSNLNHLKKYRLVCRAWSQEICKCMKNFWMASVQEEEMPELERRLLKGRAGEPAGLSPTIERLNLVTATRTRLSPPAVEQLLGLRAQGFKITKMDLTCFNFMDATRERDVQLLLISCAAFLTDLCINAGHYVGAWDELSSSTVHFPLLEGLYIKEMQSVDKPEESFFLKMVSGAPKLRTLHVEDEGIGEILLKKANLRAIQSLGISLSNSHNNFVDIWSALSPADFPVLTEMIFRSRNNVDLGLGLGALARLGSPLKSLRIDRAFYPLALPYLPHLTRLHIDEYDPAELDLSSLPHLKKLIFQLVTLDRSGGNATSALSFPSVRSVSFIYFNTPQNDEHHDRRLVPGTDDYLQLLRLFPNADTWEVDYQHVESFCGAKASTRHSIKSFTINLCWRKRGDDRDTLTAEDRNVMFHVERLTDLEELGVFHYVEKEQDYMHLERTSLAKLLKLKVIKLRSEFKSVFNKYRFLRGKGLRLILFGPRTFDGTEDILSFENFEFRSSFEQRNAGYIWPPSL